MQADFQGDNTSNYQTRVVLLILYPKQMLHGSEHEINCFTYLLSLIMINVDIL